MVAASVKGMELTSFVAVIVPLIIFFFLIKKWKKSETINGVLPPGPKKLPIIGNLHLISQPYFHCLRDLAKQYGPIMLLKMGEVDTVVVSSPEIAKQILKDKDPIFAQRPESIALKIFWYNYLDVTFRPYDQYWKQMRNVCIAQVTSSKSVRSFASIRSHEVARLLHSIRLSAGNPLNFTDKISSLMNTVICRAAFGMPCNDGDLLTKLHSQALEMSSGFLIADLFPSSKIASALSWGTKMKLLRMRRKLDAILDDIIHHHQTNRRGGGDENLVDVLLRIRESGELGFPVSYDNIKGVLLDIFSGGNETSSSTVNWAMVELLRNPEIMGKVQYEVRQVVKGRGNNNHSIEEEDVQKMNYLKLVIMETHRLHPTISVIPRVSREACHVSGYAIPKNVKVLVNAWAIHRDPEYWPNPEVFEPERFQNQSSTLDLNGSDFRYLPFGGGKRVCPGTSFSSAIVTLTLAHLLYNFNWRLPDGVDAQDLNMTENFGIATSRKEHLFVVASPYQLYP